MEAARYEHRHAALGIHGLHELARTGVELDALLETGRKIGFGEPLEQTHALDQSGFEIKLAAHRALGDIGDAILHAGKIRKLVDAFDSDHRRVHVGDQHAEPDICRDDIRIQIASPRQVGRLHTLGQSALKRYPDGRSRKPGRLGGLKAGIAHPRRHGRNIIVADVIRMGENQEFRFSHDRDPAPVPRTEKG